MVEWEKEAALEFSAPCQYRPITVEQIDELCCRRDTVLADQTIIEGPEHSQQQDRLVGGIASSTFEP